MCRLLYQWKIRSSDDYRDVYRRKRGVQLSKMAGVTGPAGKPSGNPEQYLELGCSATSKWQFYGIHLRGIYSIPHIRPRCGSGTGDNLRRGRNYLMCNLYGWLLYIRSCIESIQGSHQGSFLFSPVYKWINWGSGQPCVLWTVTQLKNGGGRNQTQVSFPL